MQSLLVSTGVVAAAIFAVMGVATLLGAGAALGF